MADSIASSSTAGRPDEAEESAAAAPPAPAAPAPASAPAPAAVPDAAIIAEAPAPPAAPDEAEASAAAALLAPAAPAPAPDAAPDGAIVEGPALPPKRTTRRPIFREPQRCTCAPSGRNLVVCIDGTSNKYSKKNTNVVELYSRLIKDPNKQLTYYNSGIGTYAQPSLRSPSFLGRLQRIIGYQMDLAFAWRFEKILLDAYHWLVDNYKQGDRIFLFGFSRGAYQVRVLSAMIDSVGLLHKGNHAQIPFAYELYQPSTPEDDARKMLQRFKDSFSRQVQVHFVGAWDSVSSVGIIRDKSLPGTTRGMGHICYFRHALALHERRVKFQPEFSCGGLGPDPLDTSTGEKMVKPFYAHTKEVWFAGSHSQMCFGPALRWVSFEAEVAGLRLKQDPESWEVDDLTIHNSLTKGWSTFELLPVSRRSYGSNSAGTTSNTKPQLRLPTFVQRLFERKRADVSFDRTTRQYVSIIRS
ncbi:hypothetical protein EXIGLDRAFT_629887 [Exidia glandulosa HHB12029]|uniref:T6SS Phospholipase effector Tle1-like catalytic domain-containing protein n=2 Tax=Exidia glandulosa HHB12029 TaxID=1314781 RepID=A0A165BGL5_EXIGL|nr:hypothetical protein EXIGLDRAFT_629887 [Exidia glandulosa HHB12029]